MVVVMFEANTLWSLCVHFIIISYFFSFCMLINFLFHSSTLLFAALDRISSVGIKVIIIEKNWWTLKILYWYFLPAQTNFSMLTLFLVCLFLLLLLLFTALFLYCNKSSEWFKRKSGTKIYNWTIAIDIAFVLSKKSQVSICFFFFVQKNTLLNCELWRMLLIDTFPFDVDDHLHEKVSKNDTAL